MSQVPKHLHNLWYKKLTDSGFIDIEDKEGRLREYVSSRALPSRQSNNGFKADIKKRYYELVDEFLNTYTKFEKRDKKIWILHSEGITIREIGTKLGYSKSLIHETIAKLKKIMFSMYGL